MDKHLLTLFLLLLVGRLASQSPIYQLVTDKKNNSYEFPLVNLFDGKSSPSKTTLFETTLSEGLVLELKSESLHALNAEKPQSVSLKIESPFGQKPMNIELVRSPLFSSDFKVSTNSGKKISKKINPGIHYRGIISGEPNSVVAFSVFDNEIMSVISTEANETFVLGEIKNGGGDYIFYNTGKLKVNPKIECGTVDVPLTEDRIEQMLHYQTTASKVDKCVNVFLECDYTLASEQGGVEATARYISGLFNAVAALYQNEEITLKVSEILVWESEDPYDAPTSAEALDKFKAARTDFNGDLAHLISRGAPVTGGIAWIGGLCSEFNYGYSYIKDFYSDLPGYSWSVNVIAHEIGHNLGSPHTHACTWNGNNTPIDGCGSVLGYDEGCSGPVPDDGGTIMSYCHLLSGVGVNFTKGFGRQPGDLIRSTVAGADCLSGCREADSDCPLIEVITNEVLCFGQNTGTAEVKITGGKAPFIIKWSTGNAAEKIEKLIAGEYSVSVTDANNCLAETTFKITQTNKIEVTTFIKKENFEGIGDGAVVTRVSGGKPPYSYFWSNGSTGPFLESVPAGEYTLVVTDANNCALIKNIKVETEDCISEISYFPYAESFEVNLGVWRQSTRDQLDWTPHWGKTDSEKTGPNSASHGNKYLYLEASRNPFKSAVLESGCIDFSTITHPKLIFNYHMYGVQMGAIEVFACESGGEFMSLWSAAGDHGRTWETSLIDLTAFAGKVIRLKIEGITGKDHRSDLALDNIRIWNFDGSCQKPEFEFEVQNILCHSGKTGSIAVKPKQETDLLTYFWSTGDTTQRIDNLKAGFYGVTVTNEEGCRAASATEITEPEALKLFFQKQDATTAGALDGNINLVATGGVEPYRFEWSTNDRSSNLQSLPVGLYMATVTDANRCFSTETIEINEKFAGCAEVVDLPYFQSWENGLDGWEQASGDDFDWTVHSGRTSSSGTGPTKAYEKDFYVYIEASNNYYKSAILTSPCFNLLGIENPVLSFAYHMYGNQMGSLSVEISADGGENWANAAWMETGNKGAGWQRAEVSLKNYVGQVVKIRFSGSVEAGLRSDMAIDGIIIHEKPNELVLSELPAGKVLPTEVFKKLNIFPNPAGDETTISFQADSEEEFHVTIFDLSGKISLKKVVHSTVGTNSLPLNISALSEGLNLIELSNRKTTLTSKFIKQD